MPGTAAAPGGDLRRSTAILTETLRGTDRDAEVRRVLGRVAVEPVTEAIGQQAGYLIGAAGMHVGQLGQSRDR
jgi:hypothetical protein